MGGSIRIIVTCSLHQSHSQTHFPHNITGDVQEWIDENAQYGVTTSSDEYAQINLYRYAAGDSLCHTNIVSCNDLLKLRALV